MIAIYLRLISLCYICDGFVVRGWIMSEIETISYLVMMNIYCVSSSIVDDKVVVVFSEHMNSYASNSKYSIEIIQCLGFT